MFHSRGSGSGFSTESDIDSKVCVFRGGVRYGYGGIRSPGRPVRLSAKHGWERNKEGKRG